jgi:NADH-quinone oxidoreductase subunit L
LFELSTLAMSVVCVIGMATALFAASIGLVQNDIKRVLAYSTCSQLGYMFAACGAGAFTAGMFHVTTHAFFKACLFLGSGAVIHAMEHASHAKHSSDGEHGDVLDPQDMRNMGGLKKTMPLTHWTMWGATMAIAGIIPFSGFFSKDAILFEVAKKSWPIWAIGVVTALMTAFYMMRLIYKTFYGSNKTDVAAATTDASPAMAIPLVILGALATVAGFLSLPEAMHAPNLFGHFLSSAAGPTSAITTQAVNMPSEWGLIAISTLVAFGGVLWAYFGYKAKDGLDLLIPAAAKPDAAFYQLLLQKWRVDELYDALFTAPGRKLSQVLYSIVDLKLVDGVVDGVGRLTVRASELARNVQNGYVRSYALTILVGVVIVLVAIMVGVRSLF